MRVKHISEPSAGTLKRKLLGFTGQRAGGVKFHAEDGEKYLRSSHPSQPSNTKAASARGWILTVFPKAAILHFRSYTPLQFPLWVKVSTEPASLPQAASSQDAQKAGYQTGGRRLYL